MGFFIDRFASQFLDRTANDVLTAQSSKFDDKRKELYTAVKNALAELYPKDEDYMTQEHLQLLLSAYDSYNVEQPLNTTELDLRRENQIKFCSNLQKSVEDLSEILDKTKTEVFFAKYTNALLKTLKFCYPMQNFTKDDFANYFTIIGNEVVFYPIVHKGKVEEYKTLSSNPNLLLFLGTLNRDQYQLALSSDNKLQITPIQMSFKQEELSSSEEAFIEKIRTCLNLIFSNEMNEQENIVSDQERVSLWQRDLSDRIAKEGITLKFSEDVLTSLNRLCYRIKGVCKRSLAPSRP
ncbi:MAG: hypothetical protein K0S74_1655 [Chlamydiales bacterium]|jgi:hypothetical protein|nr:hypothetical protein [Chlamydiales bacterium]